MPTWNNRQLPYPFLSPWSNDYAEGCSLSASMPEVLLTNGDTIDLHVRYDLTSQVPAGACSRRVKLNTSAF